MMTLIDGKDPKREYLYSAWLRTLLGTSSKNHGCQFEEVLTLLKNRNSNVIMSGFSDFIAFCDKHANQSDYRKNKKIV